MGCFLSLDCKAVSLFVMSLGTVFACVLGSIRWRVQLPINKNLRKKDVLEEDGISYEMIGKKKEMCEKWNIDVNINWPSFIDFRNYDTFEDDFNLFLERIMKETPKIAFDGMTALLSPDMLPDLPEEDEVEVPDDIDDPGVDGPYLLSDWDAEVSGVPKT
ncbi:MAG: hypothetical protein LBQ94_08220, partial [Treponema sp.]|nr:hypothetical protein [Treponema sp.]